MVAAAPWHGAGGKRALAPRPETPEASGVLGVGVTQPCPRRLLVGAPWDGDRQGDVYKCRVGPPNGTCTKANLGTAAPRADGCPHPASSPAEAAAGSRGSPRR